MTINKAGMQEKKLKAVGQNYPPTVGQKVRLLIENSLSGVKLKGYIP
jgi:hypothetical protein